MRYDSRDRACPRGLFLDRQTGQPIRWLIWADIPDDPIQPATYEAFREEPNQALARGVPLSAIRYQGTAFIRFIPAAPVYRPRPTDRRDLAGSLAEARSRVDRRLLVIGTECDEPGCHRWADWRTSWEQIIEPQVGADGQAHERAVTTRVQNWCSAHYRPPVQVSLRGVESEVEVGVRPTHTG